MKKIIGFVIGFFAAAEILLRIAGFGSSPIVVLHPTIEYYLKPNQRCRRFGNDIIINRYGMRSKDFDKKDFYNIKLFIFGDSVVYGDHYIDQTSTMAYILEKKLSIENDRVLVAAMAASSWGPGNMLSYYLEFGPFSGDIAFIVQSEHDRTDIPFNSDNLTPYRQRESVTAIDDFIQAIIQKYFPLSKREKTWKKISDEEKMLMTEKALGELISILKHDFKHVVLVYHTTLIELEQRSVLNESLKYYQGAAVKSGIGFINTNIEYARFGTTEKLYRDHIHLSPAGSEFFANMLYKYYLVWVEKEKMRFRELAFPLLLKMERNSYIL